MFPIMKPETTTNDGQTMNSTILKQTQIDHNTAMENHHCWVR
jgi:hypothetical protein